MSSRSRRASRAARHREAEHKRAIARAYDEANREELTHLAVQGDEIAGSLIDSLVESYRMENAAAGARMKLAYELATRTDATVAVVQSDGMTAWSRERTAKRVATTEIALALRIPEQTVAGLIEDARFLVEKLPATMDALLVGAFSLRHARGIVDHARDLPDELVPDFEAAILPSASTLTFSKFNQKARTLKERLDASTVQERHEKAFADRERFFQPDKNGMGWLNLYTAAHIGVAIINRTDQMAEVAKAENPYEDRTLTQLRADMTTDLLLDGTIEGRPETSIRPSVAVNIPLPTMLGLKTKGEVELPTLEGYGPIDIATARRIAAAAKTWLPVFTTPDGTGILSVGRKRKVPAALRTLLRLIDGTCRKPGCTRPAIHCDIDHTEEFQHGGMTAHDNLEHLCAKHHAEKHHTDITVEHLINGNIRWTTPSGRQYESEPSRRYMGPAAA